MENTDWEISNTFVRCLSETNRFFSAFVTQNFLRMIFLLTWFHNNNLCCLFLSITKESDIYIHRSTLDFFLQIRLIILKTSDYYCCISQIFVYRHLTSNLFDSMFNITVIWWFSWTSNKFQRKEKHTNTGNWVKIMKEVQLQPISSIWMIAYC